MQTAETNTVIYPEQKVNIIGAAQAYLTNSDGGDGYYVVQDGGGKSSKGKIAKCSTHTVVIGTNEVTVSNIGTTRLLLGWMGTSLK